MSAHEKALARLFEALTAVSVVACVVALAHGDMYWSLVFGLSAFVCFELCAEVDEQ